MNVFISNSQIIKNKKYYEISTINMNAAKKNDGQIIGFKI